MPERLIFGKIFLFPLWVDRGCKDPFFNHVWHVQECAEHGLLNTYGVHIRLSLPDTSTCTYSLKMFSVKCQSGVNPVNLGSDFFLSQLHSDL